MLYNVNKILPLVSNKGKIKFNFIIGNNTI